ncbi:MAG: murein biosynthesis integral membrane protein MurJ [Planctomycetia bacterium]|nr:murein biosynthesis integral membrane protein MurJ [Planctomycetia bacterium]
MLDTVGAGSSPAEPSLLATNRRVLASAALLGGATVAVKLCALAKDWLVARRFGASDEVDAFLVAFLIPSFAVAVLAQSFASAFVPSYIRALEQQGPTAAKRLVSGALAAATGILFAVTLLLAITTRWILPWIGMGFDSQKLALAESLSYVVLGILVVSGVSAIFAAVLNSLEHFAATAVAPLAVPIASVVVFWSLQQRFGVFALAMGTLLGFVVECFLLGCSMYRYGQWAWPQWGSVDRSLSHVGSQYLSVALGCVLMSSSTVVDQSMAASLGSGNVSILNYANKIVALVLSMVAVSLSTVLFPRFSRMITAGQWDELKRTIRGYARLILLASIPAVVLLAFFSEPLVRLLFERGAFTPQTTSAVARVQICYLFQLPFYVLVMLGARLLSALDANRTVLAISAMNLVMNVVGNYVFMHWYGVAGIAVSTSLVYFVASLATLCAIRLKLLEAGAPDRLSARP